MGATFEELYEVNFSRIYRYFYYKQAEKSDAEDLAQEVFLRYYRSFGQKQTTLEEGARILYGIARNVYREWVRSQLKKPLPFEEWFADTISFEEFVSEEFEVLHEKMLATVRKGMESLSPVMREVLHRRCVQGESRAEVAAALNISEKHVHVYQRRGIVALQKWVTKEVVNLDDVTLESYSVVEES